MPRPRRVHPNLVPVAALREDLDGFTTAVNEWTRRSGLANTPISDFAQRWEYVMLLITLKLVKNLEHVSHEGKYFKSLKIPASAELARRFVKADKVYKRTDLEACLIVRQLLEVKHRYGSIEAFVADLEKEVGQAYVEEVVLRQ